MIAPARSKMVSWALLAVLAAAVTGAVVLANIMASRSPTRLDLTSSGEHRLSPRTGALLAGLDGSYEVVLAVDPRTVPRRTLERARDVLAAFERRSDRVRLTELDLGSASGIEQADTLVQRLTDSREDELNARRTLISTTLDAFEDAGAFFEEASGGLESVREAIPPGSPAGANNRAYFEQRAAVARVAAGELTELVAQIRPQLERASLPGGLHDLNAPLEPLRAMATGVREQLGTLADDVGRFAETEAMPAPARDAARPWAKALAARRDRVAVLADRLERADALGVIDAARAIQSGQTVLVIGPPERGVSAIDLDAMLPNTAALEQAGVAPGVIVAQRTEQLVSTAIAALARPDRPIVVLVHGEANAGVTHSTPLMGEFERRLASRGVDLLEWAAAVEPAPPDTRGLDPAGRRPVVFAVLATDSSAGSGGDPDQAGARRAERLGEAVGRLLSEGRPVLVSAAPSIFPTYGDEAPLNKALASFGVRLLAGTPLLGEVASPNGRRIVTERSLAPNETGHPIADAVRGLRTLLPWAIGIDVTDTPGVTASPLVAIAGGDVWAETDWLTLWRTPRNQREFLPIAPSYDEGTDAKRDRWVVALAAERAVANKGRTDRVVIVGSNGWMLDPIAARRDELVEGRAPLAFPGNAELFEASVLWLAGQDELIAPSPEARPVAIVNPMTPGRLATVRWVLIAGLPALILLGGVVHRVLRG